MRKPKRGITTAELKEATAGGDSYIRTKNNEVRGLALKKELNPKAPDVVLVGRGPRIQRSAELFAEQRRAVPTYIKNDVDDWEFVGHYRALSLSRKASDIKAHGSSRPPNSVAAVLFLERAEEPDIVPRKASFPDAKVRKEIENAAINFATKTLEHRGFTVSDHQKDKCGYDLLATSPESRMFVEVKGTTSSVPRFYVTRNEYQCSVGQKEWRLFVVTDAITGPKLHEYTGPEMRDAFAFDPLAWECTLTRNEAQK
jgi:hypothetical protein